MLILAPSCVLVCMNDACTSISPLALGNKRLELNGLATVRSFAEHLYKAHPIYEQNVVAF